VRNGGYFEVAGSFCAELPGKVSVPEMRGVGWDQVRCIVLPDAGAYFLSTHMEILGLTGGILAISELAMRIEGGTPVAERARV